MDVHPLKMVLIGIDPYPYWDNCPLTNHDSRLFLSACNETVMFSSTVSLITSWASTSGENSDFKPSMVQQNAWRIWWFVFTIFFKNGIKSRNGIDCQTLDFKPCLSKHGQGVFNLWALTKKMIVGLKVGLLGMVQIRAPMHPENRKSMHFLGPLNHHKMWMIDWSWAITMSRDFDPSRNVKKILGFNAP